MVFSKFKPKKIAEEPEQQPKLQEVTELLGKLKDDLEKKNLLPHLRRAALERLKVLGRDPKDADPIYTKDGLHTLLQHCFDSNSNTISKEALRCLANAYLLKEETRTSIVEYGYVEKVLERYKSEDVEDEFLLARILFLMTYNSDLDYGKLVEENGLADTINQHISRHAKRGSKAKQPDGKGVTDDMALAETAKLLYNISYFYPDLHVAFAKSVGCFFKILFASKINSRDPMHSPVNNVINVLQQIDPEDNSSSKEPRFSALNARKELYPKLSNGQAEHLIQILDSSISAYSEEDLERNVSPLLGLIRRVYDVSNDAVKRYMEWLLLPKEEERNRPLGTADTLSARLLRLLQSVTLQNFRRHLNDLFFELSHSDASQLSTNLGFGFASGILMSKGVAIPQTAEEAFSTAGAGNGAGRLNEAVNPITGQKLSYEENVDEGPEMTQEEKEIEAERLYVLFERLRATGVVDVKNPVQEAIDSGRFEELPDD